MKTTNQAISPMTGRRLHLHIHVPLILVSLIVHGLIAISAPVLVRLYFARRAFASFSLKAASVLFSSSCEAKLVSIFVVRPCRARFRFSVHSLSQFVMSPVVARFRSLRLHLFREMGMSDSVGGASIHTFATCSSCCFLACFLCSRSP